MKRKTFLRNIGLSIAAGGWMSRIYPSIPKKYEIIKPARLKKGDTIGLIAPAGIIYEEKELARMRNILESMDLQVVIARHVRSRYGYLSGTDEQRAADLNHFFKNPDIDGIMTVRGGWGSNRILPHIDFDAIGKHPKFFCGFSDITSLHLSIFSKTGLITFHGPNGNSNWTDFTKKHFKQMAFGKSLKTLKNPESEMEASVVIQPGVATGQLFGGNLTVLTSLIGSGYLPDWKGALLFVEDIGEDVYRIDRMMSQLQLNGILDKINGFIFGRCRDCKESPGYSLTLEQVLRDYLLQAGKPAFYGSMISHGPDIFTIPVGVRAKIDAENGSIEILEKPVR
ncbi:MAG: LD-carboxypeptidase [Balneolaceae bacterium]